MEVAVVEVAVVVGGGSSGSPSPSRASRRTACSSDRRTTCCNIIYSNYLNYEGIKMFGKVLSDSSIGFKKLEIKTAFPKNKTIEELKKMEIWKEFGKEIKEILYLVFVL